MTPLKSNWIPSKHVFIFTAWLATTCRFCGDHMEQSCCGIWRPSTCPLLSEKRIWNTADCKVACEANGDCNAIMKSRLSCYLLKCPKPVPYPDYFQKNGIPEVKWFVELVSKEKFNGYYQVESGKHFL